MANVPLLNARVNITCKDINNNSVAKQFNAVSAIHFDYDRANLNVVDVTGSFYFPLKPVATLTYTVVAGLNGTTSIVIS